MAEQYARPATIDDLKAVISAQWIALRGAVQMYPSIAPIALLKLLNQKRQLRHPAHALRCGSAQASIRA